MSNSQIPVDAKIAISSTAIFIDNVETPVKTICFFTGKQITLKKDAKISAIEFITVDLENITIEDIVSKEDTDVVIWNDKDETLTDTHYFFNKFYIVEPAELTLDILGTCCINGFNMTTINTVDDLSAEQRERRNARIETSLKRKYFDILKSSKKQKII